MDTRFDTHRTAETSHERELLAELRSSFVFVIGTMSIVLLASLVGVLLS